MPKKGMDQFRYLKICFFTCFKSRLMKKYKLIFSFFQIRSLKYILQSVRAVGCGCIVSSWLPCRGAGGYHTDPTTIRPTLMTVASQWLIRAGSTWRTSTVRIVWPLHSASVTSFFERNLLRSQRQYEICLLLINEN